ncbi:MAG: PspC domain-containing protein [Weeksellaceae bacterium]|nr:PspC domain-containing protein [Weeksellaceae bacterium]
MNYRNNTKTSLHRSDRRAIAGVCAGIAEYFGWDVTITRVLYVLISVFSAAFPGILVYIVMWIVMPKRP